MAAICRSTIIKEGTPFTSEWSLRSLRNSHAVYVGIYIPFISEWLRRSAGICTQANEQKNISFEDVWGKSASANIISGKVATPLCLAFLGVCHNEKDSAHSLNRIMQALARCQLNEELLLLLEIICDIADMDYPQELIAAINDPLGADDLVRELILDFDEILTEEIA